MVEINLDEFKKFSSNITFKKTNTGYIIRISRSNYWALFLSFFISIFAVMALVAGFNFNEVFFILSALIFYPAYHIWKSTLGYSEVRFNENYIEYVEYNEIKRGLGGELINIHEVKKVRLEEIGYYRGNRRGVKYLQIIFKDNTHVLFSCVDPEYTACISIFIKKYMKEYYSGDQLVTQLLGG